ncbi:nucleotidyltransferase domain-containing protein [Clostridium sp.]|uniref:nucleotidyltransferase domain-containing protein n=1 Tax=Clostridium sp. TaxID=1506 RepID=UPI00284850FC|nr:nucleotidyltransferase domain-containing protein [Clostridium sp.]MDR3595574.1 nucleotidyltransferase domain-containing protein [Clostridium sp.]
MDIKGTISNIAHKYNVESVGIFGSRARKENREDSDYDIFIIGNLKLEEELALENELEKLLNNEVDIIKVSEESNKMLLKNIVNEAELIYSENNSFENLYRFVETFFIENSDFIRIRERDLVG